MKVLIGIIILLSIQLTAYGEIVNKIKIGVTTKVLDVEYGTKITAEIEKKPFMSESTISVKDDGVYFLVDTAGDYVINVKNYDEIVRYQIEAGKTSQYRQEDLIKIISSKKDAQDNKGVIDAVTLLKQNYPESKQFPDMLYVAGESAEKLGDTGLAYYYFDKIIKKFKLSEEANEKVLYKLFKSSEGKKEFLDDRYFNGKRLFDIDKLKYGKEFVLFCLENGSYSQEGITLAEEAYFENQDKELAEILGDYYYKKGSSKAIFYYKNGNLKKLSLAYLKLNDYNKFNETAKLLQGTDKQDVLKIEAEHKVKERVRGYLDRIAEAKQQQKYEAVDLFVNKIDSEVKDPEILKIALKESGEASFLKRDYKKALQIFKKYEAVYKVIKEADVYYYIAMSYFNMQDMKNSYYYFDKITKEFPNSSWDSKAKIYKIKIKK